MTTSLRTSSIVAGVSLALMVVLAPLGIFVALPAGATGAAAIAILAIAVLDVIAGVALYPVLASGGTLLAQCAVATRIAYGAVFAVAAGFLFAPADVDRFQSIWDAGLLLFGVHLVLTGLAIVRSTVIPTWIGLLVLVAGVGYTVDSIAVAVLPTGPTALGQFTFFGEVILLIWLIGWGGRSRIAAVDENTADLSRAAGS